MTIEAVGRFLGEVAAVGGSAVAVAYLLFLWLGRKWLDEKFAQRLEAHKHAQQRELEHYRYQINALFNKITKIHEKEIEVLPTAWQKLQDAYGQVVQLTSPLKYYPQLDGMPDQQILKFLEESLLTEHERKQLLRAADRLKYYQETLFWHELNIARKAMNAFHVYLRYNRIFLSSDLFERFRAMDEFLYGALLTREIGQEARDYPMISRAYKEVEEKAGAILG